MRIKPRTGLLILNILMALLIITINLFPSSILRIILGLPFVLFFPGYTLMAALFPRQTDLDSITRVALSFGLSIAVVALMGLILNYTPWGIRLESILYSMASFTLVASVSAWFRRRQLTEEERFGIEFRLGMPNWRIGTWNKALSVLLVLAIVGAVGIMSYVTVTPKVGGRFTEFYVLGPESMGKDYPRELEIGERGEVIIGIVNREYEVVSYRVEVRIDGVKNNEIGPIVLEHEEKWEQMVSFVPGKIGDNQKVEFLLFKTGDVEPYFEPLRLWLDVRE